MRFLAHLILGILAILGLPAAAYPALQADLNDATANRPWQLLTITFPPTPGNFEISVQDARGGPQFVRRVSGNSGTSWLPLPLQAPAELPGPAAGQWPIVISLRANDRLVDQATVVLTLPSVTTTQRPLPFLISSTSLALPGFLCLQLPADEILHAPALLFAACDIIYLTPEVQSQITETRALELLATGVRLAAPDFSGPPQAGGALSRFVWERTALPGVTNIWLTAAPPLPRPTLLEPGLANLHVPHLNASAPSHISAAIIASAPLAILLLLISRGLFRRRRAVLLASFLLMAGLGIAVILYLRGRSLHLQSVAHWRLAPASNALGQVLLEERLLRLDALFPASLHLAPEPGRTLLPLAATREAYWSLRPLQLHLAPETRLTGPLHLRATLYLESHAAHLGPLLPPFPQSPADRARLWQALRLAPQDARWLIAGYIRTADAPDAPGILLSAWAADHPQIAPEGGARNPPDTSTMAWYNLRFQAAHRYLLFPRDGILTIIDFGSPANPLPESAPLP